ncbi:hypothetical protein BGX27_002228 [Mortierella sp. AM989]|nr:hypothetical protein BGX27_002228 [Mortierella sp. AM989]
MIQQTGYDQFLLFGDSITQYTYNVNGRGFGAQLSDQYQRRLDVLNRGFSGYTTEQAIHLLPQFLPQAKCSHALPQSKVQFLTIFFGANDACISPSPQHVELTEYERNLRTMIDFVHNPRSKTYSPETKIILICPPPIDGPRWEARRIEQGKEMDRNETVTQQYAERCLAVGKEYQSKNSLCEHGNQQVDVIDTWGLMMKNVQSGKFTLVDYLRDGLHLAAEGNNLIYQQIMGIIKARYPEWDPATMEMHGPLWTKLDKEHPETDLLIGDNKRKQLK